jgi:GTP-binding protein
VFTDRARIEVQAGRGGDGGLSFRREKYVPKGGPDGGDGGRGGDLVLVADPDLRDLSSLRGRTKFNARSGGPGRGSGKHGADGDDVVLQVPAGTQVLDTEENLVADLARPGARLILARGGLGGRGNRRFATSTRQTPRFAEVGLPGEAGQYELRLKLLVDAALVGFPNAGKSSLLRRISNAKPKVADYPFTTISPVLGTVDFPEGRQLTVADVPGLIEGASEGVGLGHEFLAHLERARLLIHVIDASEGEPGQRFRAIDHELAEYGAGLAERPQIVALNKLDVAPTPRVLDTEDPRVLRVVHTSAVTGTGIEELKRALFELVPEAEPPPADDDGLAEFLVYRPTPTRRTFRILRTDRGYQVAGRPPGREELEAALRAAGVKPGAEVEVEGEPLEFQ